jgi:hypothetical protein
MEDERAEQTASIIKRLTGSMAMQAVPVSFVSQLLFHSSCHILTKKIIS